MRSTRRAPVLVPVLGAVAGASAVVPSLSAVGPLRRRWLPRLAGVAPGSHVALTYDDGPDPRSTPAILDLLARHDRRATFFVLGAQAQAAPALVGRLAAEGHEVAVHGWTHHCTQLLRPGMLTRQLRDARSCVEDLTGAPVCWYRPPYGVMSLEAHRACRTLGLGPVLWSAWGRDWERTATPGRIAATVLRTLRPGGTVLLHDTDLHGREDWRRTHEATRILLAGPLRTATVGPLAEHWSGSGPTP